MKADVFECMFFDEVNIFEVRFTGSENGDEAFLRRSGMKPDVPIRRIVPAIQVLVDCLDTIYYAFWIPEMIKCYPNLKFKGTSDLEFCLFFFCFCLLDLFLKGFIAFLYVKVNS